MATRNLEETCLPVFGDLRKVYEQEQLVSQYDRARSTLEQVCQCFASARNAVAAGERPVGTSSTRLAEFVAACEDSLLVILPTEARSRLRTEAINAASRLERRLGSIDPICRAELTLRKLAVLCLKKLSRRFRGKFRLSEWDRRIREAEQAFDRAVEAWQALSQELC